MSVKSILVGLLLVCLSPVSIASDNKTGHAAINIPVCNSPEIYEAYRKALHERDRKTFMELKRSKACDTVPKGGEIKILGHKGTTHTQIEYNGKSGKAVGWTVYLKQ